MGRFEYLKNVFVSKFLLSLLPQVLKQNWLGEGKGIMRGILCSSYDFMASLNHSFQQKSGGDFHERGIGRYITISSTYNCHSSIFWDIIISTSTSTNLSIFFCNRSTFTYFEGTNFTNHLPIIFYFSVIEIKLLF